MKEQKKKAKLFSTKYLFVDFIRVTGALPTLLWYRPKFIYENKAAKNPIRGGALLVANHNGFYDPIYLMTAIWYRRHRFICNKQFLESKAGWFLKRVLCIPIDPENTGFSTRYTTSAELFEAAGVGFSSARLSEPSGTLPKVTSVSSSGSPTLSSSVPSGEVR